MRRRDSDSCDLGQQCIRNSALLIARRADCSTTVEGLELDCNVQIRPGVDCRIGAFADVRQCECAGRRYRQPASARPGPFAIHISTTPAPRHQTFQAESAESEALVPTRQNGVGPDLLRLRAHAGWGLCCGSALATWLAGNLCRILHVLLICARRTG